MAVQPENDELDDLLLPAVDLVNANPPVAAVAEVPVQPAVRRNRFCIHFKNCLSWPFKKLGKGLSSYYRNHYKPAKLDLFEEFRLGRVWCQFLTLLIDCGLTNAVMVMYVYFSLYQEQSKIRTSHGKTFPFKECGGGEDADNQTVNTSPDGCHKLNDKIFYT